MNFNLKKNTPVYFKGALSCIFKINPKDHLGFAEVVEDHLHRLEQGL